MGQQIRNNLLKLLLQNQQFISGEQISLQLKCSRTAIWKHVKELRAEGYVIEAQTRNGYRLLHQPDRVAEEEITQSLRTHSFGRHIRYFPSLESTQTKGHHWAKEGAPEGALVVADQQLTGKGRLGNHWVSPPGVGAWLSLILRPNTSLQLASHFTLLTSVAVYEAIHELVDVPVEIKWPNDLLINGKKVCGILTELKGEQDCIHYLVVGIGLNVKQHAELPDVATSLESESGKTLSRAQVIATVLKHMETLYAEYLLAGFDQIKARWEVGAQPFFGKVIIARTPQKTITGIAEGLNEHGALIIKSEKDREIIYSAEIEG